MPQLMQLELFCSRGCNSIVSSPGLTRSHLRQERAAHIVIPRPPYRSPAE